MNRFGHKQTAPAGCLSHAPLSSPPSPSSSGLSYGCPSEEAEQDEDEEPFVAPAGLTIPPDVELVSDRRIHGAVVLSIDQSA